MEVDVEGWGLLKSSFVGIVCVSAAGVITTAWGRNTGAVECRISKMCKTLNKNQDDSNGDGQK